jgi:hypothetical protein
MMAPLDLNLLDHLTGGRIGTHNVACPVCGPRRRVLRVWRLEAGFATFACARCCEHGHTRDPMARAPDPVLLVKARAEAA